ncbi:MAG: C10 family peptidase [Bacteroidales bacterium]|nr:C10 family peptidase [Bacteroidales bacterium]
MNKMTTILSLIIVVFGLHHTLTARPVDLQTAQSVAVKFMGASDAQLVSTYRTDKNAAAFYVFNTEDGFVIVSADDCETPIIGYSHEGLFDPNDIPEQMEAYLQDFVARIQYGIENHIEADELTARQWELVKNTGRLNESKTASAVEPLLTEMWEQGCLYNDLCPTFSKVPCGHAEAGCIAVAMGQIMHYWRYPETGWGSHSYNNAGHTLSADFGNTIYDWDHMPDSLTDNSSDAEIEAVATLLFHCGVSVNMKYTTNGSGADSGDVPDALVRYFNYSRRLHFEKRSDFNDEEWISMLKSCLNLQRPVFYGGKGSQGSHAFVCDGYDGNDLLHFNWGWGRANGYFALGHLNPIGYSFNESNFAILDINPEYEPWIIEATAYPPTAGTIEGTGEYHIGEQCTLTAVSTENSRFCHWKKNGKIVSYDSSYSFLVNDVIDDIEAVFSFMPIKEIAAYHAPDTNDVNSQYVGLSWNYDSIFQLNLAKQFEIDEENYITTNGEYIYTACHSDCPNTFKKYTMDGELMESFNIEGARPDGLTSDGTYFYCSKNAAFYNIYYLYRYDFDNKTLIDSTYENTNNQFGYCAYDAYHDGFWLMDFIQGRNLTLVDRQGQKLCTLAIPSMISYFISGFGSLIAEDGNPHLLLIGNGIYHYEISNNSFNENLLSLLSLHSIVGACIGKYHGKDAAFFIVDEHDAANPSIYIYEIKSHLAPISHYRLYRADSEGNSVMLADEVTSTSYIDSTWNEANAGTYRFGISEVYFNGVESEIIWSDTIVKTDFGIDENLNQEESEPSVQKVIEDGHIVIIKDGKRYSVLGQTLNQ